MQRPLLVSVFIVASCGLAYELIAGALAPQIDEAQAAAIAAWQERMIHSVDGSVSFSMVVGDSMPAAQQLVELRRALRLVLAAHIGGSGLRSWGLLDELAQIRPRAQS